MLHAHAVLDWCGRRPLQPVSYSRDALTGDEFLRVDLCLPCWLVAMGLVGTGVSVPPWCWLLLGCCSGIIIEITERRPRAKEEATR